MSERIMCPSCGEDELYAAWYAEGLWTAHVELVDRGGSLGFVEPIKQRDLDFERDYLNEEQLQDPDFFACAACDGEFHHHKQLLNPDKQPQQVPGQLEMETNAE